MLTKTATIPFGAFSDKHVRYILDWEANRMMCAEGAIRSGKTIDHCIIAATYLETCPDTYHLATGSTIGNAKLNIGVCNGFGLEALFRGRCKWGKCRDNEALFLRTQTGEKVVIFAGGGYSDSYRRILGNSYGLWIATEINEHYDSPDSRESFLKVAFVMLGERLPDQQNVIKEIVPEVRVDVFRDTIELLLSMLSMQFGYGLKKYRFEQGEITTATQYAGERQDQLQELNKQREEAKAYIQGILRAALWFENTYQGTAWDLDAEITVEFDDSYVTDKASQLLEMRNDVLAGIGGVHVAALYLKEKYNLSDEEALQWAQGDAQEKDDEDDTTPPGTKKPASAKKVKAKDHADE